MKFDPNRLVPHRPALVERERNAFRHRIEDSPSWMVAVVVLAVFIVVAISRAAVLMFTKDAGWGEFFAEVLDARVTSAAFLGIAAMVAVQQAMRGLTSATLTTKRQMREQTIAHIRAKLAEFRELEHKLITGVHAQLEEDDNGQESIYSRDDDGMPKEVKTSILKLIERNYELRFAARPMLETLEQLGAGVARGVFGFVLVDITMGATVIDAWHRWHMFADQRRVELPLHDKSLDQLQWLASLLVRWRMLDPATKPGALEQLRVLASYSHFKVEPNSAYVIRPDSAVHQLMSLIVDDHLFQQAVRNAEASPPPTLRDALRRQVHRANAGALRAGPSAEVESKWVNTGERSHVKADVLGSEPANAAKP